MQTVRLLRVLLGESRDVAGNGAQLQSGRLRRMPRLKRHATGILSQYLGVSGIGFTAAQSGRKPVHLLGVQHRHFDARDGVQGQS